MTTDPAHDDVDPAIEAALTAAGQFVVSLGSDQDGDEVRGIQEADLHDLVLAVIAAVDAARKIPVVQMPGA